MLVGDDKKYLTMLVTLRVKVDENQSPTDNLTDSVVALLSQHNSQSTTVTEAKDDDIVKQLIQEGMERANEKAISRAARIQKFTILPVEFSIEGNELTSTMKLKRSVTAQKYKDEIDKMYPESQ
ncbi:PREDICTED: long-chain-fatty-acid--CoA ligase ACSBG1-like [Amphimedon queenslandica]|nr:PREDICTED: long-chain-fatty-acid--CoA ligase ACSBG1-like [Amphimedon queenslandica]|eukprot:XP_011407579.2 PREDICTED: long-chain-fatty-acid--CoA ligase ACSBG1-like [Amphimedon queenslandica]